MQGLPVIEVAHSRRSKCRSGAAGADPPSMDTSGYSPHEHRPLGSYAALTAVFNAGLGASLVAANKNRAVPDRVDLRDVAMIGIATHKLSRLIAKDRVTSFLRAPFTRYQEPAGQGELEEEARGTGMQLAIGELVICPYCLAQWVVAGFTVGMLAAPKTTRVVAGMYTAHTISDFLQVAYKAAEDRL
jgi:hypothetical protein